MIRHSPGKDESGVFIFEYSSEDFAHQTDSWKYKNFKTSRFDRELCTRWDDGMDNGLFRYTMDHVETRILSGSNKYVVQLNEKRAKERRTPQSIMNVNQPFDPEQFNFTKINPKEILFEIRNVTQNKSDSCNGVCNGVKETTKEDLREERHIVIINISPLEYGHVLIVPHVDTCQPQIFTECGIQVGLECMLLSLHRGFKIGYNSLCAYASVNHLHFHAYYLQHELMVESCDVKPLAKNLSEMLAMPAPGFAFQLHGSSLQEISRLIFKITSYFQEHEIAHNVFMTHGTVFGEGPSSENRTIRIYLWPRKKFIGQKMFEEFNVACIEFGGHLPVKERKGYEAMTDELADTIIASAKLPDEEYSRIKQKVIQIAQTEAAASI
ncbi:GDP-D-glucose phosphorylase 1-like [Gigantopelta aegis]|uniref:GDP-D-glucose phosphorylase 1-like n=1 Tax=Gigantopelta aegis TaxID=1735272 RepID=UPI001B887D53|nr:GDP-D-glucose phosphorylase 1-like [Gigantopelta aegis]